MNSEIDCHPAGLPHRIPEKCQPPSLDLCVFSFKSAVPLTHSSFYFSSSSAAAARLVSSTETAHTPPHTHGLSS